MINLMKLSFRGPIKMCPMMTNNIRTPLNILMLLFSGKFTILLDSSSVYFFGLFQYLKYLPLYRLTL